MKTETCANCGHDLEAHRNRIDKKLLSICYKCPCRKFVPINQSQDVFTRKDETIKVGTPDTQTPETSPNGRTREARSDKEILKEERARIQEKIRQYIKTNFVPQNAVEFFYKILSDDEEKT